jgi:Raf kinase inhibitor-like YbhB/YbcL family protein
MRISLLSLFLAPAVALAGGPTTSVATKLTVTSSAFKASEAIPPEFACDGTSKIPPLAWSAVPRTAKTIAIFVDDPDAPAGTFTHWLVTNLPATTTSIPKGGALPAGAVVGKNGKGTEGYTPPCPPTGRHRYVFHVFALDQAIAAPADKAALTTAMAGHLVASGELLGTYQKLTTNE